MIEGGFIRTNRHARLRRIAGVLVFVLTGVCLVGVHEALARQQARPLPASPEARSLEELALAYLDPSPAFVADRYEYITTRASDYVTARAADLYAKADSGLVIGKLKRGDAVHLLRKAGEWTMVRTVDHRVGYVWSEALSNVWVLVSKSKHMIFVYRGTELLKKLPADFAINIVGDKVRRGSSSRPEDWRTPEGIFYITLRNPRSQYYRALVLSYPTPRHARQGWKDGLISRKDYMDILRSNTRFEHPPQYTPLGGWIEFHGFGVEGKANWTHGCIALENPHIDELWKVVDIGTPVLVQPYKPRLFEQDPRRVDPRPIVERTRAVPLEMLRAAQR